MSKIEWTEETWNPVTGCTKISPGCDNCYMFAMYPRLRAMGAAGYETSPDDVRLQSDRLDQPAKWRKGRLVFVNSMSDLFHAAVPYEYITYVFLQMMLTPQHQTCLLYTSPSPRDRQKSRMPSSA